MNTPNTTDTLAMVAAAVEQAASERATIVARNAVQSARDYLDRSGSLWDGAEFSDAWKALKTLQELITIHAQRRARVTLRNRIEQAAHDALRDTSRG